jgi:Glyoxalase/Bleomycin resistance protein/Dioxygenase superfamily
MPPLPAVALDHVGIAAATATRNPLAYVLGSGELKLCPMPSGVAIARFGPGEQLELVTPAGVGNPLERFLEQRGPGLHHVALQVASPLAGILDMLRQAGVQVIGAIEPSSDGRPSAFLHPSTTGGVLVELVEGRRST